MQEPFYGLILGIYIVGIIMSAVGLGVFIFALWDEQITRNKRKRAIRARKQTTAKTKAAINTHFNHVMANSNNYDRETARFHRIINESYHGRR